MRDDMKLQKYLAPREGRVIRGVSLPQSTADKLEDLVEKHGVNRSALVAALIDKAYDEETCGG